MAEYLNAPLFASFADFGFAFTKQIKHASRKGQIVAKIVQETLVDDLDGSSADETVTFALDGTSYEIDLSKGNAKKLREAVGSYVASGRKVGAGRAGRPRGRVGRTRAAAASSGATPTPEIRAWARAKGLKVNERGRIPADVIAKFEAAN
jgi:hypothetical protein